VVDAMTPVVIHGNAMVIFNRGVLITGDSRSGKTALCQQLLKRGHRIIADDAVVLDRQDGSLYASAPASTHNKMALEPAHIVSIRERFGAQSLVNRYKLHLHTMLDNTHTKNSRQNHTDCLKTIEIHSAIDLDISAFEMLVQNAID
jgi:HPr kinase/phosphorylase